MKIRLAHAAVTCALFFPQSVAAQSVTAPQSAQPQTAGGAASDGSPSRPAVVSGLTVEAPRFPTKACAPRDKACVALVVAELKRAYPKELRQWCNHVQERAAMNTMMFMEVDPDRPHPNVMPYLPPAVTRTACAPDKAP